MQTKLQLFVCFIRWTCTGYNSNDQHNWSIGRFCGNSHGKWSWCCWSKTAGQVPLEWTEECVSTDIAFSLSFMKPLVTFNFDPCTVDRHSIVLSEFMWHNKLLFKFLHNFNTIDEDGNLKTSSYTVIQFLNFLCRSRWNCRFVGFCFISVWILWSSLVTWHRLHLVVTICSWRRVEMSKTSTTQTKIVGVNISCTGDLHGENIYHIIVFVNISSSMIWNQSKIISTILCSKKWSKEFSHLQLCFHPALSYIIFITNNVWQTCLASTWSLVLELICVLCFLDAFMQVGIEKNVKFLMILLSCTTSLVLILSWWITF